MTNTPALGRQPDAAPSASSIAMPPSGTDHGARHPGSAPPPSRRRLGWTVIAVLPISVLAALLVLHLMAASAAAATGGCGGG
ncbi:MAG TPA: hypothetical protein VLM11_14555 [Streptosporangiaceae bacterium]|nr:hypothetical protein [Streptosporangiaceae bacterium]